MATTIASSPTVLAQLQKHWKEQKEKNSPGIVGHYDAQKVLNLTLEKQREKGIAKQLHQLDVAVKRFQLHHDKLHLKSTLTPSQQQQSHDLTTLLQASSVLRVSMRGIFDTNSAAHAQQKIQAAIQFLEKNYQLIQKNEFNVMHFQSFYTIYLNINIHQVNQKQQQEREARASIMSIKHVQMERFMQEVAAFASNQLHDTNQLALFQQRLVAAKPLLEKALTFPSNKNNTPFWAETKNIAALFQLLSADNVGATIKEDVHARITGKVKFAEANRAFMFEKGLQQGTTGMQLALIATTLFAGKEGKALQQAFQTRRAFQLITAYTYQDGDVFHYSPSNSSRSSFFQHSRNPSTSPAPDVEISNHRRARRS